MRFVILYLDFLSFSFTRSSIHAIHKITDSISSKIVKKGVLASHCRCNFCTSTFHTAWRQWRAMILPKADFSSKDTACNPQVCTIAKLTSPSILFFRFVFFFAYIPPTLIRNYHAIFILLYIFFFFFSPILFHSLSWSL